MLVFRRFIKISKYFSELSYEFNSYLEHMNYPAASCEVSLPNVSPPVPSPQRGEGRPKAGVRRKKAEAKLRGIKPIEINSLFIIYTKKPKVSMVCFIFCYHSDYIISLSKYITCLISIF
jgi:hypothetical protein